MRKIYIFLSTILAILILTSCNNEINIGDEIIKDGLIYEVVDVTDYYININELTLLNKCYYKDAKAYYYDYYFEQLKNKNIIIHILNLDSLYIEDNYLYKDKNKIV